MKKSYKGHTIVVEHDECPENPRTWADQTIIYSNHRDYNPDNHKIDELMEKYGVNDVNSLVEKMQEDNVDFARVYAHIHSGIALRVGLPDRSDEFDTGLFGLIVLNGENAGDGVKGNPAIVQSIFEDDIEQLEHYYNGEVYEMEILDDMGELEDCCGGFLREDDAVKEGEDAIDSIVSESKNALDNPEIPTSELKEVFYKYATDAPAWVDEVMEMVEEPKLRKWLREKIKSILTKVEINREFSQWSNQ